MTGDGLGDFLVTVRSGAIEATASLAVTPDSEAPVVSAPKVALVDTGQVGFDRATLGVSWIAHDNVGVARVQLQRRVDSGDWRNVVLASPSAASATSTVPFGRRVQFRARATDRSGNTGSWILGEPMRVLLFNDNHTRVTTTGAWVRKANSSAIGANTSAAERRVRACRSA